MACLTAASFSTVAQVAPAPSPLSRVMQTVGLSEIEVEYSSPALKGRDLFGSFVTPGELWRTGANSASKITFSTPVKFGDAAVEAGTYAIFTIPEKGSIQVILNSNAKQGGTGSYDAALNVASVNVPLKSGNAHAERMRFAITDFTNSSANLQWAWGTFVFEVPMTFDTHALADEKIAAKFKEMEGQFRFYHEVAAYYLDSNRDAKKALEMAQKSVDMNTTFWNTYTLARAYAANGDKKNAKATAEKSMAMSQEADYQPYVEMNKKLIAELK